MKRKFENTEEDRPVIKMARIEEIENTSTEVTKKYNNESAKVILAQYTLNDLKALENKFNRCYATPIEVSEEAIDGSSIHVDLKTSLFESVKHNLIQVLNTDPDIEKAATTRVTKAKSNSGEADVEYMADVVFIKGGNKHQVILKCFTTKCRIQIQKRGKHVKFPELGSKFVPKYFMDFYIVPFASKILSSNPSLDDQFIPHLAREIERLRLLNKKTNEVNKKGKIQDDTKCVNAQCKQKISKNINASAQCDNCDNLEHFKCAGTKAIMKEDIKEDIAKFFCTVCIDINPLIGRELLANHRPRVQQIVPQVHAQVHVPQIPAPQVPAPQVPAPQVPAPQVSAPQVHTPVDVELEEIVMIDDNNEDEPKKYTCDSCEQTFLADKDIRDHVEANHKKKDPTVLKCTKCTATFTLESNLSEHLKASHVELSCEKCDYKGASDSDLSNHVGEQHPPETPFSCTSCTFTALTSEDLETHKAEHHMQPTFKCQKCDFETIVEITLETHIKCHESIINDEQPDENMLTENATLKKQVQAITDSYDRLASMYKTAKEEAKHQVSECKKELEDAQETLRVALTENEKLRETNDIQNNLWKIWMKEYKEKDTATSKKSTNDEPRNEENKENVSDEVDDDDVVEVEDEDDINDPVNTFLRNMRKGFKRASPAAPPEPKPQRPHNKEKSAPKKDITKDKTESTPKDVRSKVETNNSGKKYCHYWNNSGKCSFRNCIFAHEKSPVCNYDGNCNRKKCMFSHSKQNKTFLANRHQSPRSHPTGPYPPPPLQEWATASPPPYWGPPAPWAQWGNPWAMTGFMGNNVNQ